MDFYEYIDDFKNGRLSGDNLDWFTEELAKNASLRLAVDNYDAAKDISEGLLEVDIMDTLDSLKNDQKSIPNKVFNIRRWTIAASVIGLLLVGGWWMLGSSGSMTNEELWAAHYQLPINDIERGTQEDNLALPDKAKLAYHYKEYNKSVMLFKALLVGQQYPQLESQFNLYLGHGLVAQKKYKQAALFFEASIEPEAIYNLALVYVQMGEKEKAVALLKSAGTPKADSILSDL